MPEFGRFWCYVYAAGLFVAATTAPAFAQMSTSKRFPQLTLEQLNTEQRSLGEEILKVSSVGLGGPYNLLLRSPALGDRMFKLLDYLRFNTSLPRRLNELAILIQARRWTSQVEWFAHYPLAIKAGLAESVAADLKAGRRPTNMKP
jgi:4-carboxymuconolactone decarboxylase